MELSDAELDNITAATLRIGTSLAGDITISLFNTISGSVDLDPANVDTLHLITDGGVHYGPSGSPEVSFKVHSLAVSAKNSVVLQGNRTKLEEVAVEIRGIERRVIIENEGALKVKAIDNVVGVKTKGALVEIITESPLTIDEPVIDTEGGSIVLIASNDGGEDDHLTINAPVQTWGGDGSIELTAGTNLVINETGTEATISVTGAGTIQATAEQTTELDAGATLSAESGDVSLTTTDLLICGPADVVLVPDPDTGQVELILNGVSFGTVAVPPDGQITTVEDGGSAIEAPQLSIVDVNGGEGSAIPLPISAQLTTSDGSQSLSVKIVGAPLDAMLSNGTRNDDGSWVLSPSDLEGLTITLPDESDFPLTITATATDITTGATSSAVASAWVQVTNVAPTAAADAYNADVFTLLQVDTATGGPGVLANDTDPAGAADPLTVTTTGTIITTQGATVTMNSDGGFEYNATTSGTLLSLAEGLTIDDTFNYEIADGDGGIAAATVTVTVTGGSENSVHVIDSPCGDGTNILIVRGSPTGDNIDVKLGSMANTFKIKIKTGSMGGSMGSHHGSHHGSIGPNGSFHIGTFKFDQSAEGISKVIVYGLDGNDNIKVDSNVGVMGWLFGGNGDDKLRGGKGDDLLVGGAGNDKMDGKDGRDIVIGGLGADEMKGHKDEDILIAGSTIYDNNLAALCGITNEWTSANSFADRVDNIFDGSGSSSGANGPFFFDNTTVNVSDGEMDKLDGGSGSDWFIADEVFDGDKVNGFDVGEDIFGLDINWFDIDL